MTMPTMRATIPASWLHLAWRCLGPAAVVALTLTAGAADADRVRTREDTEVHKRSGEQSPVVTRVEEGTTLVVLATDGRWLKVRVNGRTGWITRASVVTLGPDVLPRNTRRRPFVDGRSTQRDASGDAPDDRVGADAVDGEGDGRGGDDDRDEDDERGGDDRRGDDRARRDDRTRERDDDKRRDKDKDEDDDRADRRPARTEARTRDERDRDDRAGDRRAGRKDDDEDEGEDEDARDPGEDEAAAAPTLTIRVARARLYQRPSRDAEPVLTLHEGDRLVLLEEHRSGDWLRVEVADDDAVSGYVATDAVARADLAPPRRGRALAASARLGFASVGGSFQSNGSMQTGGPDPAYSFSSGAVSLALAAEATFAVKPRIMVGGQARYLGCVAAGGFDVAGAGIGFSTHDVDLLALGGYDLRHRKDITVWARAGLHVGRFSVALDNPARLPVEAVLGPVLGAAVRVGRLTPKLGAEASFDVMPTASRAQTANQTDGQLAATRSMWLQLAGHYALAPRWQLEGGYQLGYAGTRWAGDSDRHVGATAASRTDLAHVLNVGVARPF